MKVIKAISNYNKCMANKKGEKRFRDLYDKMANVINHPNINTIPLHEYYQECRVLILKYSDPTIFLSALDELERKDKSFNNVTKLQSLASFIKPLIEDQLIDDSNRFTTSRIQKQAVHALFLVLLSYINWTFEKVWDVNFDDRWNYALQLIIVSVFFVSLFNKLSEKHKLLIEIVVTVLISTFLTLVVNQGK